VPFCATFFKEMMPTKMKLCDDVDKVNYIPNLVFFLRCNSLQGSAFLVHFMLTSDSLFGTSDSGRGDSSQNEPYLTRRKLNDLLRNGTRITLLSSS